MPVPMCGSKKKGKEKLEKKEEKLKKGEKFKKEKIRQQEQHNKSPNLHTPSPSTGPE